MYRQGLANGINLCIGTYGAISNVGEARWLWAAFAAIVLFVIARNVMIRLGE